MDTRYHERGYVAEFYQNPFGDWLTIRRNGEIVAEVGLGIFAGGSQAPVSMYIKRFSPDEFKTVKVMDDFDAVERPTNDLISA